MQQQQPPQGPLDLEQMQNYGMNLVELFCAIFCMPIELILRPKFGSRYFSPPVWFLSSVVILIQVAVADTLAAFSMPLIFMAARVHRPEALFGMGSLAKLFFVLSFIHGFRIYRRMFKPELENHSRYEGPPVFLIQLIPGSRNFWLTRVVIEPAIVLIIATVLQGMFLFQPGLAHYLQFAAICLSMKSFIDWYKSFQFLRDILDARHAGPIIASFVENAASQEDLNSLHLANLPKDLSPEMRRYAAVHIARIISPGTTIPEPQGDSHANQ